MEVLDERNDAVEVALEDHHQDIEEATLDDDQDMQGKHPGDSLAVCGSSLLVMSAEVEKIRLLRKKCRPELVVIVYEYPTAKSTDVQKNY